MINSVFLTTPSPDLLCGQRYLQQESSRWVGKNNGVCKKGKRGDISPCSCMCLFDGSFVAASQRLPWLWHYDGSCHNFGAMTEVATTVVLSWRLPQPQHYHSLEAITTVVLSQRPSNHCTSTEAMQPRCFHRGHSDHALMEATTFTEVTTNTTLSLRMPWMWLYPKAATNVMLSWRLHKHGAITMAAATAADSWEGKKNSVMVVE